MCEIELAALWLHTMAVESCLRKTDCMRVSSKVHFSLEVVYLLRQSCCIFKMCFVWCLNCLHRKTTSRGSQLGLEDIRIQRYMQYIVWELFRAVQSSTTDVHPLFSSNTVHEHRPQCATFSKLHRVKSSFIFIAAPKIRLRVTWPLSVIVNSMWYLGRLDSPSPPIPR